MSGLSSGRLGGLVAEKLWEMCFHFVGPEHVSMDKSDEEYVLKCLDALGTLVEFNYEFGHGRKAMETIADHAERFFEIGLWYDKKRIANAVLKSYRDAIKVCYSEGKLEFRYGRTILRRSVRKLQRLVKDEQPDWKPQQQKLEQLLNYRLSAYVLL